MMWRGKGRGVLKSALNFEYPAKKKKKKEIKQLPPIETLVKKANFLNK